MAVTDQVPTQSGFPARSTGTEVLADVDVADKTAIVTGGYSGIGLETTRALAAKGVTVIVPVRSPEKPFVDFTYDRLVALRDRFEMTSDKTT